MSLTALAVTEGHNATHSKLPLELITGTGSSPKPRLRVDPSQTSFWEGREFRMYHEFTVPAASSVWIRFVSAVDVVLHDSSLVVVQGNCRLALSSGGTAAGTWTEKTVVPMNGMSDVVPYTGQVQASVGGSATGVTEVDLLLLETGSSSAVSVSGNTSEVGFPAGTYFIELRNTGGVALRGLYKVHWEEHMPRSSVIHG